jgi:hypothetical protein
VQLVQPDHGPIAGNLPHLALGDGPDLVGVEDALASLKAQRESKHVGEVFGCRRGWRLGRLAPPGRLHNGRSQRTEVIAARGRGRRNAAGDQRAPGRLEVCCFIAPIMFFCVRIAFSLFARASFRFPRVRGIQLSCHRRRGRFCGQSRATTEAISAPTAATRACRV